MEKDYSPDPPGQRRGNRPVPFTGGRGSIVGAALGALVIRIINDIIVLIGPLSHHEYIFVAVILILAGLQARGGIDVK